MGWGSPVYWLQDDEVEAASQQGSIRELSLGSWQAALPRAPPWPNTGIIYSVFICYVTGLNELKMQRLRNAPLWGGRETRRMEVNIVA